MNRTRHILLLFLLSLFIFITPTYAAVTINPTTTKLYPGESKAVALNGTTQKVTWLRGKFQGTVKSTGKTTGKITAGNKVGTYWIAGKVNSKKYHCKIFVVHEPKLNKTSLTIEQGGTRELSVKDEKNGKVSWSSSNTKVATVSSKGTVTAKAVGTATITAKVNGKTLKCYVTVTFTEMAIAEKLPALSEKYPTGMYQNNCYSFARTISDALFGSKAPFKTPHSNIKNIKIGDIVHLSYPSEKIEHYVIPIAHTTDGGILVGEGNLTIDKSLKGYYPDYLLDRPIVYWGRYIPYSELIRAKIKIYSRY